MQVNYCDLCGIPLKEYNYFILYVSEPKDTNYDEMGNTEDYIKKVQKGVKEICPSCKHIFYKMFELRLQKLSELAEELNLIYELKSNPKERKNGKEKK